MAFQDSLKSESRPRLRHRLPTEVSMWLLLTALALPLPSASTPTEPACTAATLRGRYVFVGTGFIEALEPGVQRLHYGLFNCDGAGKVAAKQSSSRGGKIGRENLEGTYTLESDCS